MSITITKEAIINSLPLGEPTTDVTLPPSLLRSMDTKEFWEHIVDQYISAESIDPYDCFDNVHVADLIEEASPETKFDYLMELNRTYDLSEFLASYNLADQGYISIATIEDIAQGAIINDLAGAFANKIREAVEAATGEDPCSYPNNLTFA